jgi:hypothetical protein
MIKWLRDRREERQEKRYEKYQSKERDKYNKRLHEEINLVIHINILQCPFSLLYVFFKRLIQSNKGIS